MNSGNSFTYTFAALRGRQAGKAYYVAMCPLRLIPKLFLYDEDELPAEFRAQRPLNRTRIPAIARYMLENPREYVFSSITASVDAEVRFDEHPPDSGMGSLVIPMTAKFIINDGQHRRAAIEEAIRERPLLGDETISVVVFADRGLKRSQQMFADLNIHAVRPTKSLKLLYDHRDALAGLTREVVDAVPLFRDFTCFDTSSISNRSIKLFTLSSLHQATAELIGKSRTGKVVELDRDTAVECWTEIIKNMPDWQRVGTREIASHELRRDYIHAHGVAVQAIAAATGQLLRADPTNWRTRLSGLRNIDWSRANGKLWNNRALVAGKVNKSKNNVILVTNIVARSLGLPLTPEAKRIEDMYAPELKAAG